jgi:alpha-methylacyl-CoA racemase
MGADVVRVLRPDAQPDDPKDAVLRGRRRVAIDLKAPAGMAKLSSLLRVADVLIEGFRPGVMERLGVGPETVCGSNARLVYGRITGWGQFGPMAPRAGHDINYIALTGALSAIGTRAAPVPPLNLVGDYGGGAMFLLAGILAALVERSTSGLGQVIDSAMVDGTASLMSPLYAWRSMGMWPGERCDNLLDGGAPFYGTYQCADGEYFSVGSMEPKFFAEMLRLMGLREHAFELRDDRTQWPALKKLLEDAFLERPRAEWRAILENSDACCVPILAMSEAPQHPHMDARQSFRKWNGVDTPAPAPRFSRTPGRFEQQESFHWDDPTAILRDWQKS